MNRGILEKLCAEHWVKLFDKSDLEVCLVPSGMPGMMAEMLGVENDSVARKVCTDAFTNFRNWENPDGTIPENTIEERLSIFSMPLVRQVMREKLQTLNQEITLGEGSSGSA